MSEINSKTLGAISFIGDTLAPFFLQDPKTGVAGASFAALKQLDVVAAAKEWPFVQEEEACIALDLAKRGLEGSCVESGEFEADESITWEYRRLFVGPAAMPAPPWGSVYTDRECVIFGASTLELRAWMRKHGIARTADENIPEDHIGLLLGLMAWLAANQSEDLCDFLRLHLLTWSSHYLDELAAAAQQPFYEGLAKLTNLCLEGIRETLGLQVTYPRYYR